MTPAPVDPMLVALRHAAHAVTHLAASVRHLAASVAWLARAYVDGLTSRRERVYGPAHARHQLHDLRSGSPRDRS